MSPDPDGSSGRCLSALGVSSGSAEALIWILLLLLVALNAFFTAGRYAVLTLSGTRLKKLSQGPGRAAARLKRLTEKSGRFLSTIQAGLALSGYLAAALAARAFSGRVARLLPFLPASGGFRSAAAAVLVTLLLSCAMLVFGQAVPHRLAVSRAESAALRLAGPLCAAELILRPVTALISLCAGLVLRLFGAGTDTAEQTVTEEEILQMVDAGEEKGVLNENEKDMISNIFEFSDSTVGEAMTHRTDVSAVEDTDTVRDVVAESMENGYSRIPVYHEDLDNIIGIIHVKDLLQYVGEPVGKQVKLIDLMRPAYFVPKSKPCAELFSEMTARRIQIAVVVDEFGGTEGIITMEDLLESIVGNIQDEYDNEEEEIHRESENRFDVDGTTPVDEISELTGTELPEGDYDTVAGLMMDRLGRIPKENEHPQVRMGDLTLTVAAMEDRRIARVLIEKDPVPPVGEES